MNVIFVSTIYPSEECTQYGIFVEQLAQSLISRNVSVEILIPRAGQSNKLEKSEYNNITVYELLYKPRKATKYLQNENKEITALLSQFFKTKNYDIANIHFINIPLLKSVLKACKKSGIKVIQHFHGLNVWNEYYTAHKIYNKFIIFQKRNQYKQLDSAVCVSEKVKSVFIQNNRITPVYTVYNGVNLSRFTLKPFSAVDRNHINIICTANLIPIKGQKYLIEAARLLIDSGYNVFITFVGRGSDEIALKNQVKSLNLQSNIRFAGYVQYDMVADLMKQNDIFIMPSFYEALGCVYLEAMASGLITVGVKNQGIDEIIDDGQNGYLIEPKSVESIVEVIKRITSDSNEAIIKNASNTISRFSWSKSAEDLIKVYKETLK